MHPPRTAMMRNLVFPGHGRLDAWGLAGAGQKLPALLPTLTTAFLLSMLF